MTGEGMGVEVPSRLLTQRSEGVVLGRRYIRSELWGKRNVESVRFGLASLTKVSFRRK